jgi:hypothetical protein
MIISKAGFEGLDVKEVLQQVFSYLSVPEIHAILLVSYIFFHRALLHETKSLTKLLKGGRNFNQSNN